MSWIYLIFAGLLEVVWAGGLKQMGVRPHPFVLAMVVAALGASMFTLYLAMIKLPVGIAYPIWTGIGSIGSVVVGAIWFGQHVSPMVIAGVGFLIIGMVLLGADTR